MFLSYDISANQEYMKDNIISVVGKYNIPGIVKTKIQINQTMVIVGPLVESSDIKFFWSCISFNTNSNIINKTSGFPL